MSIQFSYLDYVSDANFMKEYREYQRRFSESIRESDKVLIQLVRGIVEKPLKIGKQISLLDIGCSTGNLLRHVKQMIPDLALVGGDMVASIVIQNRKDPALSGIRFEEMDLLDLDHEGQFDIVIANAVLFLFDDDEFNRALSSISAALKPNGWLIAFDLVHPFEQDLAVFEKSNTHPKGIVLHFRPYSRVMASLEKVAFTEINFSPFAIPIDLKKPDNLEELNSYTISSKTGERLLFRGTLFQPWCHLSAQRKT